mgnify:CR=1 FL=1
MRSLSSKLTLSFVIVALVGIVLVAFLANQTTASNFEFYLSSRGDSPPGVQPDGFGGMMGGMMRNPEMVHRMAQMMGVPERGFLQAVNNSIWIGGMVAVIVAVGISVVVARQITLPLRNLTLAAKNIAGGDLSQRVQAGTRDEIGELASAFNSMAESLARNEQVRRNMVADIAHELRTPLSVIQGNLEAILDGVVEPTTEHVSSIHEETLVLARLVSDLRELSLAEAGQLKLQKEPTDLAEVVRKAVSKYRPEADEKGINLGLEVAGQIPVVNVDPQRISQVIGNLLSNAVRHTGAGGDVCVSVRLSDGAKPAFGRRDSLVLVSVADTGGGIPAEELPFVFERFYRLDKSRSRSSGGSGIGLAIVKHLVEAHCGQVWAESEVGKGSIFSFSLPLNADPSRLSALAGQRADEYPGLS